MCRAIKYSTKLDMPEHEGSEIGSYTSDVGGSGLSSLCVVQVDFAEGLCKLTLQEKVYIDFVRRDVN